MHNVLVAFGFFVASVIVTFIGSLFLYLSGAKDIPDFEDEGDWLMLLGSAWMLALLQATALFIYFTMRG